MSSPLLTAVKNLAEAHRRYVDTSRAVDRAASTRRALVLHGALTQAHVDAEKAAMNADDLARSAFDARLGDVFLQANLEVAAEQAEADDQAERERECAETLHVEGA